MLSGNWDYFRSSALALGSIFNPRAVLKGVTLALTGQAIWHTESSGGGISPYHGLNLNPYNSNGSASINDSFIGDFSPSDSAHPFLSYSDSFDYVEAGPRGHALLRGGYFDSIIPTSRGFNLDNLSEGFTKVTDAIINYELPVEMPKEMTVPTEDASPRLRGSKSKKNRKLGNSPCINQSGVTVGQVVFPGNAAYTENRPFTVTVSNTVGLSAFAFSVTMTTGDKASLGAARSNIVSGTMPYSGSFSTTVYPLYTSDEHYNGLIPITIQVTLTSLNVPACQTFATTVIYGDPLATVTSNTANVFDALTTYLPLASQTVSIGSTASYPISSTAFRNFDNVPTTITASYQGGALPHGITYDDSTGAYGTVSVAPTSGDQVPGTYNIQLKLQQVGNTTNTALTTLQVVIPNRAPTAFAIPSQSKKVGEWLNATFANPFKDPDDGASSDIVSYSAIGNVPFGMVLNMPTTLGSNFTTSYFVTKISPANIQFTLQALDKAGAAAQTNFIASTSPSLTSPYDILTIPVPSVGESSTDAPTQCLLPSLNITTLSNSPIAATYKLESTAVGALSCNTPGVISSYNPVTGTLTITGTLSSINTAQTYYHPAKYYSGTFGYTMNFNDGGLNIDKSYSIQGIVTANATYGHLKAGVALSNSTVAITPGSSSSTIINLPSTAVINNHQIAVTYSLQGNPLPSFMAFDTLTGSVNLLPIAGNQGVYPIKIRVAELGNIANYVDLDYFVIVPKHAPVSSSLSSQTLYRGLPFTFTLPETAFTDADGPADFSISATGLITGMSFDSNTRTLAYTPGISAPQTAKVTFIATDSQNAIATIDLNLNIQSSLTILPPSTQILAENIGLDTPQFIALPSISSSSSNNGTITYGLTDTAAGSFAVNATAGVTVDNQSWQVILSGPFSSIKNLPVAVIPTRYRRTGVGLSATIDDGLNPVQSISFQQGIQSVYVPLRASLALSDLTISIGTPTPFSVGSLAFANPHNIPVSYSLLPSNGTIVDWVIVDAVTGEGTVNPSTGTQGLHSLTVRVQGSDQASNYVDLPFSVTVPNHAPVVVNPLSSQTLRLGEPFIYTLPRVFNDVDGMLDIVTYTASGLPLGASFNSSTQTISYLPTKGAQSTGRISIIATDSQGRKASADMDITVVSSLNIDGVSTRQDYTEDMSFGLPNTNFNTPATGPITLTYQLSNSAAGRLALNATSSASSIYQAGVGKLTLVGAKAQLQACTDKIIFTPTDNFNDDVDIAVKVDDGLNAITSQSYTIHGTPTYDPLMSGSSLADMSVLPTRLLQFTIPDNAFINPDKDELRYSIEIQNAAGNVIANSTTLGWTIAINQATKQVNVVSPVGVQGDFNLIINAQALDASGQAISGKQASIASKLILAQTIVISNKDQGTSLFEDTPAMNSTLAAISIDYLGEQAATVSLTFSSAIGSILPTNFAGLMPSIISSNGFIAWKLTGPKAILNQHLANLKLEMRPHFNGLGNNLIWSVDNGVDPVQRFVTVLDVVPIHHSPVVSDHLLDKSLTAGDSFAWTISASSFAAIHQDANTFTITVTQEDGNPLPGWAHYDIATRTLSGKVPDDFSGSLGFKVTATDSSTDPSIPLTERQASQTFRANITPQPSKFEQAKSTVASVAGAAAFPALILSFAMYIYYRRNARWNAATKKLATAMNVIKSNYSDIEVPTSAQVIEVFKRIELAVSSNIIDKSTYNDLDLFVTLFTNLGLTTSDDERKLLYLQLNVMSTLVVYAKEIGAAIKQNRINPRTQFLLTLGNSLLNLVIVTETAHTNMVDVYDKLAILNELRLATDSFTPSLCMRFSRVFLDCCVRPCFGTGDDSEKEIPLPVRAKYKNLKAGLSRIQDQDGLCGIFSRLQKGVFRVTQVPDYPKTWYDNILIIQSLVPLAKNNMDALNRIQEIYRDTSGKHWHVIAAAKDALTYIASTSSDPLIVKSAKALPLRPAPKPNCFTRTFCRQKVRRLNNSAHVASNDAIFAIANPMARAPKVVLVNSSSGSASDSPEQKTLQHSAIAVPMMLTGHKAVRNSLPPLPVSKSDISDVAKPRASGIFTPMPARRSAQVPKTTSVVRDLLTDFGGGSGSIDCDD
ncbi:MAG: putative Ig domain-containing protein [Gammaproteobacteria bacterium]|nr:putative Ig domain-containing protein [Gammaproteobacteria bacterium]